MWESSCANTVLICDWFHSVQPWGSKTSGRSTRIVAGIENAADSASRGAFVKPILCASCSSMARSRSLPIGRALFSMCRLSTQPSTHRATSIPATRQ
jgi:hypothetical protein